MRPSSPSRRWWDEALQEARDAGIPVILTDRAIETQQKELYATFIGSDFVREGMLSGEWLVKNYPSRPGQVRIVELQGKAGSAPAVDRAEGFRNAIKVDRFMIVGSQTGDFTRAKGEKVMRGFLAARGSIDVVFAHNDDMALGAIKAIDDAGLRPGIDITVISIDGIHDGIAALAAGKMNFIAECSPLLGPQLMELVKKVVAGESVPARIVTAESTFTQEQAKVALPNRRY
jgi:ABC-type sugar transport system substrate-binding protein